MTSSDIDGVICAICGIPKVFIKFMPHYDVDCRSRACNRVQFSLPNMSSRTLPQPRKCPTIVDIEEHCECCYYECMTNRIQNGVVSNVVLFRTLCSGYHPME